jgi:protoheme IX farnesyltransferase
MTMTTITACGTLCRLPVAFFAAAAAFTGTVLAFPHGGLRALLAASAVLLLSCGVSALNQYQEQDIDSRMERTRLRPLPSGALAPRKALILSLLLIGAGLGVSACSGALPLLLCAIAVIWYNGVYTPLKRSTAFAAVYGAPVGMLPPAIGWSAGGGSLADPRLFAIVIVIFLWQIPHFWLLLLRSGDDYERAGLPSLTRVFSPARLARLTAFWTTAAASAAALLPLYGMVRSVALSAMLMVTALLLAIVALRLLRQPGAAHLGFTAINLFLGALLVLLAADSLIAG